MREDKRREDIFTYAVCVEECSKSLRDKTGQM